ncbi:hypothetical protein [Clostridium cellulovorans]|uniref:Uncharacterized protein n=1 Tax=Clostridium cellulovorans (strain ATCC 35296 / DSM 3052 / OCM 3 / 743B) TaxID=573061 RepID=D9SSE2_CLOC7|nr:hypothetical protein [Clostridium cellulovorans]ADL50539.1 hypothetical protein Clocel_0769 [Clostridium cellulovorans 743B]
MATHKCGKCVWSNKIYPNLIYCFFPKCVIEEETQEKEVRAKRGKVASKARTKRTRRRTHVSKKTKKAL